MSLVRHERRANQTDLLFQIGLTQPSHLSARQTIACFGKAVLDDNTFYYLRRQYSMISEYPAEMLRLAAAKQLPQIELYATFLQSWCLIELGQSEQGMAQLTSSLAAWQASGTLIGQPFLLKMAAQRRTPKWANWKQG